jgi:hypothetical protein
MITLIKSKKIALKFFIALILSSIITLLNEGLPQKKFSEYNVNANLSENVKLLMLFLPVDKRHSLSTIFLSDKGMLKYKLVSNLNTVKQCSIATVNNEKIISSKLTPYSLNLDFIVNDNFNASNCDEAIEKQLNEMFRLFFQSLMQYQVKIYQENLILIENSDSNKSKLIENILNKLKREDSKNVNINLMQSSIDTKSLIGQKNNIDNFQKILNVKNPFIIYGEKISIEKTHHINIFIFCFIVLFVILNYSLFYKYLIKILN